ncbi:ketopantoate reductase family protein [Dasania marina]|uniref:ketopantoate reductase family protein n=1 Tax=Dasania marina TaxID=471499 RepID=UPI000377913E|nr:2-dehydropantoate 2-reductase [Dasania marina]
MTLASHPVHWHILGAGAIGSLWSARWHQQGVNTTAICRQLNSEALSLDFFAADAHFSFQTPRLIATELQPPIHHLLITTKAQQCLAAFASVAPLLSEQAVIIVLQNGMAVKSLTPQRQQRLYAATTTDGAHFSDPHTLRHVGQGETHIGPINTAAEQYPAAQLLTLLPRSLRIHFSLDIEQQLWRKLAINCAINALGVKYQCRNGELISREPIRQELIDLCREITTVAKAQGLGPWFDTLYEEVAAVAALTGDNINSTLQDIKRGKATEISALNGYLCDVAKKLNIATPLNQALVQLVLAKAGQS